MFGINFKLIAGVMLFVILISIQITLNKILMILKQINIKVDRKDIEKDSVNISRKKDYF
ncbi:hypothetical protein [Peptostreptococcus canis]|uniref:Uncharacterized protein n=1 Tax=Peptostreptococcus canis TaxID=1159213 RepID=A0ABR6TJ29_9FIRM|nr:hypothetical protein [Peptostreptococcus canis]MBC2575407.1 hypothetical protein [Peptostreptococcus canis]MBP1997405.1 hypothetical protein [Peptostreptococcus canis]